MQRVEIFLDVIFDVSLGYYSCWIKDAVDAHFLWWVNIYLWMLDFLLMQCMTSFSCNVWNFHRYAWIFYHDIWHFPRNLLIFPRDSWISFPQCMSFFLWFMNIFCNACLLFSCIKWFLLALHDSLSLEMRDLFHNAWISLSAMHDFFCEMHEYFLVMYEILPKLREYIIAMHEFFSM